MLTGDKIETAINIGYSCQLITDTQEKIMIDGKTEASVEQSINDGLKLINEFPNEDYCLILTGDALIHAVKEKYSNQLISISDVCSAVIACRVSPKQKQEVVSLVKNNVFFIFQLFHI